VAVAEIRLRSSKGHLTARWSRERNSAPTDGRGSISRHPSARPINPAATGTGPGTSPFDATDCGATVGRYIAADDEWRIDVACSTAADP
jgi:hypothetical protein